MLWSRRSVLWLGAAALTPVSAAASGERRFSVIRDGDDIGTHVIRGRRDGEDVVIDIQIRLAVKILGITAYRYELDNQERWRDGQIVSINSKTNDDGDADFARVRREGDRLMIEGSAYSGEAPGDAATTSYWSPDFLTRSAWINTQTGKPLSVSARKTGVAQLATSAGNVSAENWSVTGDFEVGLAYANREWVGCVFDAGGEEARYVANNAEPILSLLS